MRRHALGMPLLLVSLALLWCCTSVAQASPPTASSLQGTVDSLRAEMRAAVSGQPAQALVDSLQRELIKQERRMIHAVQGQADYEQYKWTESIESVMTGLVFIAFFAGLFAYLILRQNNQRKVYLAAIEHGASIPLPRRSQTDARRPALVLMAVGLGYFIAIYVTLSYMHEENAPAPLAVSIWGIIPILVGGALWIYQRICVGEGKEGRGSASESD